jgi:hypothetical protein
MGAHFFFGFFNIKNLDDWGKSCTFATVRNKQSINPKNKRT